MSNATSPTDSQGSTIITTSSPSITTSNQHYQAGLAGRNYQSRNSLSSTPASSTEFNAGNGSKYRASVDAGGYGTASTAGLLSGGLHSSSNGSRNWPNSRAGAGNSANNNGTARPASELLGGNNLNNLGMNQFVSPETEAIDRWFEDLQHYEATLEEMAAASLDVNFKEELSAIEQWFSVLSEAERTTALYSLLQSSTQVQMRFFVTVLQQMSRSDPMAALLSPAKPGQASMEAQMEAKLASLGLKSPEQMASPAMRQFARQSLGGNTGSNESYLSPHSAAHSLSSSMSSNTSAASTATSNVTINADELARSRNLKASSRTSAPANILLGATTSVEAGLKSPLWIEERERNSMSANMNNNKTGLGNGGAGIGRPKSAASNASSTDIITNSNLNQSMGPPPSASYLRSSISSNTLNNNLNSSLEGQLSPIVGGSWASMTSTPLIPMFGGRRDVDAGIPPGDYGSPNPAFDAARADTIQQGIVLDDVRKFRRSARMSGSGLSGGALGGMYDEQQQSRQLQQQLQQHQQQQLQQQQNQLNQSQFNQSQRRPSPLNSMQQSAMNLNGPASPGINRNGSPGPSSASQQTAVAAQTNWRNGLGSPNTLLGSPQQLAQQQAQADLLAQELAVYGLNNNNNNNNGQLSANAQFANLFAMQQQMLQQQQFQSMNLNLAAAAAGLTPQQMLGLQQQQHNAMLSPRMGMNNMMGMNNNNGMNGQSRRSPRPHELRSPNPRSPNPLSPSPGATSNVVAGSGSNPLEPLDMMLLADVPNWLRSLRLHKYTPQFEGSNWKTMVLMDDADLEKKGVGAVGARRKLLKVFETVRSKTGMALPGDGATAETSTTTNVSPSLSATEDA